ncbi:MAG: hypothetical protein ACLRFJ_01640 [Alphaproteobacteria bacterium]
MKLNFLILPFACAVSLMPYSVSVAALRVSNNARQYNAKNNMYEGSYNAPVAQVANSYEQPVNDNVPTYNDDISVYTDLDACSMIYPTGKFAMDRPTAGMSIAGPQQCVAVVELRGYQMGENGSDLVLARANVAAGDGIKCNIDSFPEYSFTAAAANFVFPADSEPTIEDVTKVMNQEQKQNAGLKIAAGALLFGIGGNIAGKNDVGNSSLMGTDKGKVKGTALGALLGTAVMAGSTYTGYETGNIILSAGMNMAFGGIIGNMAASGDSVMRIENCNLPNRAKAKCLWGAYVETQSMASDKEYYYDITNSRGLACGTDKCDTVQLTQVVLTKLKDYADIRIKNRPATLTVSDMETQEIENFAANADKYCLDAGGKIVDSSQCDSGAPIYYKVDSAAIPTGSAQAVMIDVTPYVSQKPFGWKKSDWTELRQKLGNATIYLRTNTNDDATPTDYELDFFNPVYQDASEGGIVDLGNKARLKSTLIGAGAGGALGAFAASQGAQDEINNRWVAAVREYKDSLQKVYCATGTRFLSYYNDMLIIPKPQE